LGEEYSAHPAAAELPLDAVGVAKRSLEALPEVGHCPPRYDPRPRDARIEALEVRADAYLHMPRQSGREPALHRRARCRGVFGERSETEDPSVEHVPHRAAQLEVAPDQRDREIGDGIVGQPPCDVLLVAPQPLPPDITG